MKTLEELQTEENEILLSKIKAINPALSPRLDGNFICGTFRAKKGTAWKYSIPGRCFIFNGAGYHASEAIEKAFTS